MARALIITCGLTPRPPPPPPPPRAQDQGFDKTMDLADDFDSASPLIGLAALTQHVEKVRGLHARVSITADEMVTTRQASSYALDAAALRLLGLIEKGLTPALARLILDGMVLGALNSPSPQAAQAFLQQVLPASGRSSATSTHPPTASSGRPWPMKGSRLCSNPELSP